VKKVLITGIDSFTGTHLSSCLCNAGYDIYGTSLSRNSSKKYRCDITKKSDITKVLNEVRPDFIIHLSGISFAAHGDAEDFYKVNTIGTTNILEVLVELELNPKKVILVSSATVYGNQGKELLEESMCPKPVNHYGISKLSMEHMAANYFDKLSIIITRPFNYTGVGQASHFLIPKIVEHFKEGKKEIELGNIHVAREFNDVNFVVDAYHKLLLSQEKSAVVNLSSNRPVKLLDVINMMQEIAGYEISIKVNPAFVRANEIKSLAGSTDKLKKIIDISFESTLKSTLTEMYES